MLKIMAYMDELNEAVKYATNGEIDKMYGALKAAKGSKRKRGQPELKELRRGIEHIGLSNGLASKLEELQPLAIRGEKLKLEAAIKTCQGYADRVQQDIYAAVCNLRNMLDETKLPELLARVTTSVKKGDKEEMAQSIAAAKEYAGSIDIEDLIEAVKGDGPYNAQIDAHFAQAMEYARRGCERTALVSVANARDLATQYGIDVSAQEKEIEKASCKWKMDDALKRAKKFAKQKRTAELQDCIATAQECADKLEIDISKKIASVESTLG